MRCLDSLPSPATLASVTPLATVISLHLPPTEICITICTQIHEFVSLGSDIEFLDFELVHQLHIEMEPLLFNLQVRTLDSHILHLTTLLL